MKRFEPNLLLAISTGVPFLLLLLTASVYGLEGATLRYCVIAAACILVFVLLNERISRRMFGRERPPMIHADTPSTAKWATLFPLLIIFAAVAPVFFPGHDYGLLVIGAACWFGLTIESAIKARRQP